MRPFLLALVAAAMPLALFAPMADLPSPLPGAEATDAAGRWISAGVVAAAALLLYAALRLRSYSSGAAFAAALTCATFPAMADAALSPGHVAVLVAAGLAALALAEAGLPRILGREPWSRGPVLLAAASGAAAIFLARRAEEQAAAAIVPAMAAFAPAAGFVAGAAAEVAVRRDDLARGARAAVAAGLALVLAGAGWASLERCASWRDPVAFWNRAVRERPDSAVPLGAAAAAAARAEDREGAVDLLRRFAEVANRGRGSDPAPEAARRAGAYGAAAVAGWILAAPLPGEEEVAAEALRAAEALCPTSAATVRLLGEAQMRKGAFVEAVVTLERAVALDRGDAVAWDALARARLRSGRPVEAIEAARTARDLRPSSKEFTVTLAEALLDAGLDADALETLHGALGPLPGNRVVARAYADAHLRVARKETSAGEKGRARRRLLAGLEAIPDHRGCLELLDRLNKQYAAERPEADRLLDPGPDGSVTIDRWIRHVTWLCRWGRYDEAGAHFDDMLRRFGSLADVHYHRGREFWESRGTPEGIREAVSSYREAVARDPKHVESWNRLWRCLALLGKAEDAARAARRFLELAPEHPDGVEAEIFLDIDSGDPPDAPPRSAR